ncbi:ASCH domain-containing protein [Halorhabdus sp. CBA1104]|uniref:ASCH domain-containing protein n=1 Tax=unclassified Halorhabdus TaxID=2621901 RepID=UPI0012B3DB76|nr:MULTISPECIES: ASCH domain-containing protein [unclassified Halorhabdus]QGN05953.1 ASCH domain-containing protein [Halorhabdus sp. CBA1104]
MAHRDATEILPGGHLTAQVLDGDVTQIHRGQAYAAEGDTFDIDGTTFEVTDVAERTLGDLTDEDAQREGSENLAAYKQRLARVHDEFEWNPDSEVVRHRFEPAEE